MPKAKISKKDRIRTDHEAFLVSHGIDPNKRPQVRPTTPNPLVVSGGKRVTRMIATSDQVPSSGVRNDLQLRASRGQESAETVRAIEALKKCVAQPYNKGPFMLITDPEVLKQNMRRPGGI